MKIDGEDRAVIERRARLEMLGLYGRLTEPADDGLGVEDWWVPGLPTDDLVAAREAFRRQGALRLAALELLRHFMVWAQGKGLNPQEALEQWAATQCEIDGMLEVPGPDGGARPAEPGDRRLPVTQTDPAQARRVVEQIRDQLNALAAGGDNADAASDRIRLGDIYPLIAAYTIALDTALDVVAELGGGRHVVLADILDLISTFLAKTGGPDA